MISNAKLFKACVLSPMMTWVFVIVGYFLFRYGDVDNIGEFPTTLLGSVFYIAGMCFEVYLIVFVFNILIMLPLALVLRKFDVLSLVTLAIGGTGIGSMVLLVIGSEFKFLSSAFGGLVGLYVSWVFSLIASIPLKNR